jgi:hypothetical protein
MASIGYELGAESSGIALVTEGSSFWRSIAIRAGIKTDIIESNFLRK